MKEVFEINPYEALKSLVEVTSPYMGKEFLKVVCSELKRLYDSDLVFITEAIDFDPTTKVKILYSTEDGLPDSFELEGTPCKLIYDNEIIEICEGINTTFEKEKDTEFESFYGIPLHNKNDNCIGHIAIFSKKKRVLDKEIRNIAMLFARRIEVEYERDILETKNKIFQEKLQKQIITDHLTKLYNRRYFNQIASDVLHQVKRDATKATLVFIDIDDFKKINDKYGHEIGDRVLIYLADVLQTNHRKGIDYIFRIGGEEFAIISINSNMKKSLEYLNIINKRLKENSFSKDINITLSIGLDSFEASDKSFDEVYKRADCKMYEAKKSGKDRIIT